MNLIKGLIEKIETAGEVSASSEAEVLQLPEKKTRLQDENINTEREYSSVFKTIMNSMTRNY